VSVPGRDHIDPQIISRVGKLAVRARLVVEGFVSGMHRSPYRGFSVEFAEHREYVPGDDLRYLDWKVLGKTDRYYVKRYEEETNLVCHVVLDVSESMDFGSGDITKHEYARTIAACLAYLVVRQQDAAGLVLFDETIRSVLRAGSHRAHVQRAFDILEEARPSGRTDVGSALRMVAEKVRKRGLVVVISDLMGDVEEVLGGLRQIRTRGHDVIVFHVLDPAELTFPFDKMTLFEGLEQFPDLLADPKALRKAYLARLEEFQRRIRAGCLAERIDIVEMNTATPLDVALSSYLARRAATRVRRGA
jgi:uncharacterized protein (DUF58 family)